MAAPVLAALGDADVVKTAQLLWQRQHREFTYTAADLLSMFASLA
jgi:hypothetical protein